MARPNFMESGDGFMNETTAPVHINTPTEKKLWLWTGFLGVLLLAAVVIFGPYVLFIALTSYVVALIIEWAFAKSRGMKIDRAWMITPMIITLMLPPIIPLWIAGVATGFGVFFGKAIFGGHGRTVFNPALVGVLFVLISFPSQLNTQWFEPKDHGPLMPSTENIGHPDFDVENDAVSSPALLRIPGNYTTGDFLLGRTAGAVGETFMIGIITLGIGLMLLKVFDWRVPLALLGTMVVLTLIMNLVGTGYPSPVTSLLVGSATFAAFFVAPDPVTSPIKSWGKVVYGIGAGILIFLIRYEAAAVDGVVFGLIIMNAITPLIDSWFNASSAETKTSDETKEAT